MNTKKITTILLAVAMLSVSAAAQTKTQLKQENTELKALIDSLKNELARTSAEQAQNFNTQTVSQANLSLFTQTAKRRT